MRALSATELLGVWERGLGQPPVQQALTLLAGACPESPPEALARLSIGQRDARLLALRELTFGGEFTALASCPACAEKIELTFRAVDLAPVPVPEPPEEMSLQVDGRELRFRVPNSADLLAATDRGQLLDRCLLTGRDHLPDHALELVIHRMAQADPLADIQLALSCAGCGHTWRAPFDIVTFFWRELQACVRGLLREVHTLASAYGWREADILALSPARRRLYLEMVSG